ncbi:MAG: tRNA (adenosine(37)-N6)-threonylcarbamoyltransferase complex transferase subunit TsaD [Bacteroidetes bacterium]|nr:tRNA (adenosine(37)-N6)-threonylcarbamoyltransferase complex transferase subunit TsaD [Bacteroidota bacterium]
MGTFAKLKTEVLVYILGIESSCDDTAAAITGDTKILANIIANQQIHRHFGGVVPEWASRAHQQNIIPVVEVALQQANISKDQLHAIAFTRGPGLLGSLLVGTSFAKAFSLGLDIPLIDVDHLQAHILAHFIQKEDRQNTMPAFPFLCLTVSGGHTQIVLVTGHFEMKIIGHTLDDAAGETFDKAAKIMGLPYPGGPVIDQLAMEGNPNAFSFSESNIPGLNYSFSGLKTSFLYFLRDQLKKDAGFIENNKADLSASIQHCIVNSLLKKLIMASRQTGIREIAISGGVSANSYLQQMLRKTGEEMGWKIFIPAFSYSTDNAAMVAVTGYFKYLKGDFCGLDLVPYSRQG